MKRTFARFIAGVALLAGMFLFASRAEAQQGLGGGAGQINWKPAAEALQVSVVQVEFWHGKIDQYAPGTSNYLNVHRHINFYKNVYHAIEAGESVGKAVDIAMGNALPAGTPDSGVVTPKSVINAMRDEAIELLAQ